MPANQQAFYDYDVEAEDLRRRQAVLDAMQQQSMSPIDVQSSNGIVARASPLQGMAKLLQAYVANKGTEALKAEKANLATQANEDLRSGLEQYYRTSQGYDAPSMVKQPNPDGSLQTSRMAADPKKAIFDALSSKHPLVRDLGMQQLQQMGKQQLTPKDLLAISTPESVLTNPNNPQAWLPKRELKAVAPGEILLDSSGNVTTPGTGKGRQGNPGWETVVINGDLYQKTATGLKKLDNAPKVNVNANPVIMGQKAGMQEYFKNAASQVDALGKVATNATQMKQTLSELQGLDSQGIFSNVTSGPATFLSNLGQIAGVKVDPAKLGNTETFNALTTDLWQGLVSKYGGNRGVTQQEAAEIKRMLPLATSSPQARQQLYRVLNNVADRQIMQYQNANKAFAQSALRDDPTIFSQGFGDVYVPTPSTPNPVLGGGQPGGKVLTLDQYLRGAK